MADHSRSPRIDPISGFNLAETDRLLKTTKQVRKRMDLTRPVSNEVLLECIDVANHAPMGGNLERNRWMIIKNPAKKAEIAKYFAEVGRPYLQDSSAARTDERSQRVIDSARFLIDHLQDVPAIVLALRLDRPPIDESQGQLAAYYGSVLPGVWSFQLAARSRGIGSAWTTFHLEHESAVASLLEIPGTVTQVCLLPVGYYTGDDFSPAARRPVTEITYLDTWKNPVD